MQFSPIPKALTAPCAEKGTLVRFSYETEIAASDGRAVRKDALVYLPCGYEAAPERRYPLLMLMHGGGGDCRSFFAAEENALGQPEARSLLKPLLDNAISSGYCEPMIVVTPSYQLPGVDEMRQHLDIAQKLTHRFPAELTNDLLPALSSAFRVREDRWSRAFGGFSMGAETTWSVMSACLGEIATYLPMSGDWWIMGLKGGKDFPDATIDALIKKIAASGASPDDFRVLAFTGDKDIAFEALDAMIRSMRKRPEWFTFAEHPTDGNACYCLKEDGWHTYDACYEYLCLALPYLFR